VVDPPAPNAFQRVEVGMNADSGVDTLFPELADE
jgi:hypothetical protein